MLQGWMGSDYTNDDILNESSLVTDFDVKIVDAFFSQQNMKSVK